MCFISASLLGKLPPIFIYTIAGKIFVENKILAFLIFGCYFMIFLVLSTIYTKRKQKGSN
jgi:uncharacterized membrane protein YdjX (TVP38/TMEM64 family)